MRREIEFAARIEIGLCINPRCTAIHFRLFDDDDRHFAMATVGVEDIPDLTERLRDLAYQAVTTKRDF